MSSELYGCKQMTNTNATRPRNNIWVYALTGATRPKYSFFFLTLKISPDVSPNTKNTKGRMIGCIRESYLYFHSVLLVFGGRRFIWERCKKNTIYHLLLLSYACCPYVLDAIYSFANLGGTVNRYKPNACLENLFINKKIKNDF